MNIRILCLPVFTLFRTSRRFHLGLLVTLALLPIRSHAVDVELFGVHKGQEFKQNSTGAPVLNDYYFTAFARAKAFNTVWGVRVHPQGSADRPLGVGHDFDFYNYWSATDTYASQQLLDAAHPDTNYVLTLNTVNDGPVTVNFNLTGSAYPNPPHVANFAAAQAVRAEADFTLQWDAFTGGTTNDHIRVEILDVPTNNNQPETSSPLGARIFRTADPRAVAALDGTATSVTVPAGTMAPGHKYKARVHFVKLTGVDTNSYPEVEGIAGYVAATEFALHTVDVRMFGVMKGQAFSQTDANAPGSQNFVLQAFLDSRGTAVVNNATVQLPNGGATYSMMSPNDIAYKDSSISDPTLFNTTYPDGIYQMTITTTNDGTKTLNLTVTNVLAALTTPHVSNFDAAQAVNPAQDFTLTWDALGGTTNDYVQVQVKSQGPNGNDNVFHTRPPQVPGALNGTHTSVTIPAFTLAPGTAYSAELMYARLTGSYDTVSYPGAVGVAGSLKRVSFTLRTPDVRAYSLTKRQDFLQTNNVAPVALNATNFLAIVRVNTPGTNNVTSASLVLPNNGGTVPLPATNDFKAINSFPDQSTLDANVPPGTYQITVATVNDGNKTLNLVVPATAFPNAPKVNGFNALQSLNPHRDQVITWNAFVGGTTSDHVRLEIVDPSIINGAGNFKTIFNSPRPGELGALNGTNTSVQLPANTLQPGRDYLATLVFAKLSTVDTTSYPGAVGTVSSTCLTTFNIHTRGSHPAAPLIGGIIRTNAQTFLSFFGETNRAHRIEVVSDLKAKNWQALFTNGPAFDGSNGITDGSGSGAVRFYRVTPVGP